MTAGIAVLAHDVESVDLPISPTIVLIAGV
jgi:hypothetical protein